MDQLPASKVLQKIVKDMQLCRNSRLSSKEPQRKVVCIIGAGVAHAAAGFPLGPDMAQILITHLGANQKEQGDIFQNYIRDFVSKYNLLPNDFKTILFSLHQMYKQKLVAEVTKRLDVTNRENINTLIHETLTYLFTKDYVDGIVNFNFDEILEHTMVKEDSQNTSLRIVNASDAVKHETAYKTDTKRFISPIHLKPHGTVSIPSSLRFARNDFYRLEPLVRETLLKLLGDIPVTIVLIGFRIKNLDFTKDIASVLQPGSTLYVIDKERDVVGKDLEPFFEGFMEINEQNPLDKVMIGIKSLLTESISQLP